MTGLAGQAIMLIETERMTVRDFKPDDVNDLHEILGDAETMKSSKEKSE